MKEKTNKTESQKKRENDEKAANGRVLMAHLKEAKLAVLKQEKSNFGALFVYRSKGNWWKMGGNSALMYYYEIAERIGRRPKLNRDTDFFAKFHTGIISIKNIESLEKKLDDIGIKLKEESRESQLIKIFVLDKEFTKEELDNYQSAEKQKIKELNEIAAPKLMMPRVGVILKNTAARMYKMKIDGRNPREIALMNGLVKETMEMAVDYVVGCKNKRGKIEDLEKAVLGIDRFLAKIPLIVDYEVCRLDEGLRMGEELEEAQKLLLKEIKKMKEANGDSGTIKLKDAEGEGGAGEQRSVQELVAKAIGVGESRRAKGKTPNSR